MMDGGRNFGLDGLRSAAIVAVVAAHALILFWPGVAYEAALVPPSPHPPWKMPGRRSLGITPRRCHCTRGSSGGL